MFRMNLKLPFLLAYFTVSTEVSGGYEECTKDGILISDIFCLPKNYRKDVPPHTTGPLNVFFKLPVTEISQIDDKRSQITLRLAYKIRWPEHRMILNDSADWSRGEINVRPDLIKHFWTPDIIIHDLIRFTKPEVLNEVAALEIVSDHSIYYKVSVCHSMLCYSMLCHSTVYFVQHKGSDITIVCKGMVFLQYPMDKHSCFFKLSSYGYEEDKMKLSGKFSYERYNQRTLNFHVDFKELDLDKRTWQGSSSK
ncbi:gamma-aminobutyric acid receptor subunit pi isoform X1 [Eurytemora carolleeae]|uniref:gamma-aminobutyric acid receptor subunit pi isoform X1 n=1 Tax=Eurytemora carolleeae TaxID=1294199 RepID=UPI000C75F972|nr:gamma-aminobutyric acid receptor subunit pi isoform X1 [Eurytemora carolleeae]|eukprot:XP_023341302.1 gamma-aminobutyric acid receptor subunit pi-like isoform X1 [Eurytemora affinis]